MPLSNYEITKRRVQAEFSAHDIDACVRKFSLAEDERYLYLSFIGRNYRICKADGCVQWSEDRFITCSEAGFNETLSLFDLLLDSAPNCAPAGTYCRTNSLPGLTRTAAAPADEDFFSEAGVRIQEHPEKFRAACRALGGTPEGIGDISYRIPIFGNLCAVAQFWFADDEFGPRLNVLWDSNMLQYVRYETVWYIHGHLLSRLREEMEHSA